MPTIINCPSIITVTSLSAYHSVFFYYNKMFSTCEIEMLNFCMPTIKERKWQPLVKMMFAKSCSLNQTNLLQCVVPPTRPARRG